LGISVRRVQQLADEGSLPCIRVTCASKYGSVRIFERSVVEQHAAQRRSARLSGRR
jgi:hypothetical protein